MEAKRPFGHWIIGFHAGTFSLICNIFEVFLRDLSGIVNGIHRDAVKETVRQQDEGLALTKWRRPKRRRRKRKRAKKKKNKEKENDRKGEKEREKRMKIRREEEMQKGGRFKVRKPLKKNRFSGDPHHPLAPPTGLFIHPLLLFTTF